LPVQCFSSRVVFGGVFWWCVGRGFPGDGVVGFGPLRGLLAVMPFPYYGGLQSFALGLAGRLGVPVAALGSGRVPGEHSGVRLVRVGRGVGVFRTPLPGPREAAVLASLASSARLVHLHGPFPVGEHVVVGSSRCLVYSYHFDVELVSRVARGIAGVYEAGLRRLLSSRRVCLVTASTRAFAESSRVLAGVMGKVRVLPLGVDAGSLEPGEYGDYVSFAGRLIPEKGVHVLVRAVGILRERGVRLGLEVIGKPVDAWYASYLRDLVRRLGLAGVVRFHGFLPRGRMLEVIGGSRVHALPSTTRLESFGIVLLEAGGLARPLVSTRAVPGAVELILRSRGGRLAVPGDARSLADAIEEVAYDAVSVGARARRYVLEHHDWPRVVEAAVRVYREALES